TGPRIANLARQENTVTITFDRPVTSPGHSGSEAYSSYFTAFWGPPESGTDYDSHYGGNEATILSVERLASDPTKVRIELAPSPFPPTDIYLRYKRPHEPMDFSEYEDDVIRGADSGLPLPSFGPLLVGP